MPLELKDLTTQKMLVVPEEGITFGREGGDANIQLRDTGVSKRHARVFGENGAWFLEDLGSSNGTWLQKERIKDATELLPGDVFQLSQAKFEVVQVTGAEEGAEPTSMAAGDVAPQEEEPLADENEPTPKPMPAAAKEAPSKAAKAAPKENGTPKGKAPPAASKKLAAQGKPEASSKKGADAAAAEPADAGGGGGEPKKITVGYFLVAVPKAFAYYLGAVPAMLVNPVGAIRKAVKEQKHEAKGRWELVAYALPAQLIGAAFGFLGGLIYGLVTHTLSIGDILPVGRLIAAVIISVVTGFVWHPFLNWWVKWLKGTSDDRSRTNVFMLVQTATALMALPAFVSQVLGLVSLPLIGLIPLVLSLASSLIMLFIWFLWFNEAGVVKWFRTVLLVLGGLACLSTLAGLPGAIAGRGTGVSTGSADAQVAAAEAQAEALRAQAEAQAAAAEAQAEAAQAQAEGKPPPPTPIKAHEKAAAAAPPAAEPSKAAPPPPAPAPAPAAAAAAPPPAAAAAPPAAEAAKAAPPAPTGAGYGAWHTRWEAIEKRISDDPTVLKKNEAVLGLYKQLENDIFATEAKWAKGQKPNEKRVNDHLRDAELYEKTEKTVNELYGKLFAK